MVTEPRRAHGDPEWSGGGYVPGQGREGSGGRIKQVRWATRALMAVQYPAQAPTVRSNRLLAENKARSSGYSGALQLKGGPERQQDTNEKKGWAETSGAEQTESERKRKGSQVGSACPKRKNTRGKWGSRVGNVARRRGGRGAS